jgi:hypothetical protein
MTVLVAVRTSTAVVFAADSKLTTQGFVGFDPNGDPLFVPQTYDNAVKLGFDASRTLIAAVTGNASMGEMNVIDYLSQAQGVFGTDLEQDEYIQRLILSMGKMRFDYWTNLQLASARWPFTAVLIATTSAQTSQPRVWRVSFAEDRCEVDPILPFPSVWLDGSYNDAFCLLYGRRPDAIEQLRIELNLTEQTMEQALQGGHVITPLNRLNVGAMPIQDAMDLAGFLARVQIEMDRFLPGAPLCGGPVDLVVLQGTPYRVIREFPGKSLEHPKSHGLA